MPKSTTALVDIPTLRAEYTAARASLEQLDEHAREAQLYLADISTKFSPPDYGPRVNHLGYMVHDVPRPDPIRDDALAAAQQRVEDLHVQRALLQTQVESAKRRLDEARRARLLETVDTGRLADLIDALQTALEIEEAMGRTLKFQQGRVHAAALLQWLEHVMDKAEPGRAAE